ncbi:MAG: glycosyltransferase family 4 protein [Candidatus Glassbacteria bacterium]|nr:glycosyltransferase family 4 protein [Candidatus Glassbacteria bacterium]
MKVLYIVTSYKRSPDDIINPWMVETISRLRGRGVDVTVYTSAWHGQNDHEVDGTTVRRFRYLPSPLEMFSHDKTIPDQIKANKLLLLLVPFYILGGIIGLRRVLRLDKYDLVHVHWPFPLSIFGWFASRWAGAPLINQFYGVELMWVINRMRVFIPFLRWTAGISDLVVAISTYTRNLLKDISPETDVEIVPYGSPVPPPQQFEPLDDSPERTRRVLFVGRLVERKGVEYLVKAMKKLDLPFPVELDIVGGGPEESNLNALVDALDLRGRVHMLGRVDDERLAACYRDCDCFVLPAVIDSRGDTEGLGVVLIEALSYRKPVIASNVGGIVDIVKDGHTGLAVPEKDPAALAEAIARLMTDRELAGNLGNQGYDYVKKMFDWDRLTGQWLELYGRLTGPREENEPAAGAQ